MTAIQAMVSIVVAGATVAIIVGLLWLEEWLRPPTKRRDSDAIRP